MSTHGSKPAPQSEITQRRLFALGVLLAVVGLVMVVAAPSVDQAPAIGDWSIVALVGGMFLALDNILPRAGVVVQFLTLMNSEHPANRATDNVVPLNATPPLRRDPLVVPDFGNTAHLRVSRLDTDPATPDPFAAWEFLFVPANA